MFEDEFRGAVVQTNQELYNLINNNEKKRPLESSVNNKFGNNANLPCNMEFLELTKNAAYSCLSEDHANSEINKNQNIIESNEKQERATLLSSTNEFIIFVVESKKKSKQKVLDSNLWIIKLSDELSAKQCHNWEILKNFLKKIPFNLHFKEPFFIQVSKINDKILVKVNKNFQYITILKLIIEQYLSRDDKEKEEMYYLGKIKNFTIENILFIVSKKLEELENTFEDPLALYDQVQVLVENNSTLNLKEQNLLKCYKLKLIMALYKVNSGFDQSLELIKKVQKYIKNCFKEEKRILLIGKKNLYKNKHLAGIKRIGVHNILKFVYYYNNIFVPYLPSNLVQLIKNYQQKSFRNLKQPALAGLGDQINCFKNLKCSNEISNKITVSKVNEFNNTPEDLANDNHTMMENFKKVTESKGCAMSVIACNSTDAVEIKENINCVVNYNSADQQLEKKSEFNNTSNNCSCDINEANLISDNLYVFQNTDHNSILTINDPVILKVRSKRQSMKKLIDNNMQKIGLLEFHSQKDLESLQLSDFNVFFQNLAWNIPFHMELRSENDKIAVEVNKNFKCSKQLNLIIKQYLGRNNEERLKMYYEWNNLLAPTLFLISEKLELLKNVSENPVVLYTQVQNLNLKIKDQISITSEAQNLLEDCQLKLIMSLYKENCGPDKSLDKLKRIEKYLKQKLERKKTKKQQKSENKYSNLQRLNVKQYLEFIYCYNNVFVPYFSLNFSNLVEKYKISAISNKSIQLQNVNTMETCKENLKICNFQENENVIKPLICVNIMQGSEKSNLSGNEFCEDGKTSEKNQILSLEKITTPAINVHKCSDMFSFGTLNSEPLAQHNEVQQEIELPSNSNCNIISDKNTSSLKNSQDEDFGIVHCKPPVQLAQQNEIQGTSINIIHSAANSIQILDYSSESINPVLQKYISANFVRSNPRKQEILKQNFKDKEIIKKLGKKQRRIVRKLKRNVKLINGNISHDFFKVILKALNKAIDCNSCHLQNLIDEIQEKLQTGNSITETEIEHLSKLADEEIKKRNTIKHKK